MIGNWLRCVILGKRALTYRPLPFDSDGWVVEAVFHGSRGQLLICPCWEVRVFTRVACFFTKT